MGRKDKLGNKKGVSDWRSLATAGDCKRYLAWCIHSVRDQELDPKTGFLMARMGYCLLKSIEIADIETQLLQLEEHRGNHAPVDETRTAH